MFVKSWSPYWCHQRSQGQCQGHKLVNADVNCKCNPNVLDPDIKVCGLAHRQAAIQTERQMDRSKTLSPGSFNPGT